MIIPENILSVLKNHKYKRDYFVNKTKYFYGSDSEDMWEKKVKENRKNYYINNPIEYKFNNFGYRTYDDFKKVQQENMELKQQLELMKMCGKVNKNPTLKYNPNFHLLVAKCSGIVIPENKKPDGSLWDDLKDEYKKENPDVKLMGDKFIGPKDE